MKITRRGYLFLWFTGLLMAVGKPSRLMAQGGNKNAQRNQAQFLTAQGHKQLNQGQYWEAFATWEEATKIYRQLRLDEGVTGNLINQNLAQQALGLYSNACDTILSALKMDKRIFSSTLNPYREFDEKALYTAIHQVNPTSVNLLGLLNLGDVLRLVGKLNESEIVLKETLSLTQQMKPKEEVSSILLSLGNTKQSMYERAQDQYKWVEEPVFKKETVALIQQNALFSLDYYEQVNNIAGASQSLKLKSQLHRLSLLLDFHKWLTTESRSGNKKTVKNNIYQQIQASIDLILKNSSAFSELSISQSAYAKLNFAENLNKTSNKQLQSVAVEYAESALQTAKSLKNQRLESYSWGTLAKLQPEQSQTYFEQALGFAQSVQAWDIAYQWQQKLGDLYSQQGKSEKASKIYEAAISSLTQVRTNLLSSNPDTQFFFYEQAEPVYRNYMRLLLANSSPNLKQVLQTNGQLQIAQLENFLQCGKLDLVPLNELQNLPSTTAIIYIIDLDTTIEVIVQSPDQSLHHHSVDSKQIRSHVINLLNILQSARLSSTDNPEITSPYQRLYKVLIAPIKTYLPSSGTLVFALDASFQSLPMGLLHDEKDYLIKRYSIAQTLGSKVRPPKSLSQERLTALIAGLSKRSPSFNDQNAPKGLKALPGVAEEVADVKKQTTSSKILLDEKFTSLQFQEELSKKGFPIMHISTHGQFSSQTERTVFLAYDKVINILEFDRFIKDKTQSNENAIELLVLSACQTAKGNKKSTLGMAGVAAQAGAQSIVASLWLVDEGSTAQLMEEFYEGLKNGLTKAEALRLAQLSLSSNPRYTHPYFWAGFVLVGGWL